MVTQLVVVLICLALALAFMVKKFLAVIGKRSQNSCPSCGDCGSCQSCGEGECLKELKPK